MLKAVHCISLVVVILVSSCKQQPPVHETTVPVKANFSETRLPQFTWWNAPTAFEIKDSSLIVTVDKGTDFFNSPEDSSIVATAPLLYQQVQGDFVAKALVTPDFNGQWNAVALMMHADSLNWIKFAFENSDATGPSIVSVVTKDRSDDANGAILEGNDRIWLAIARKDSLYAMHWSKDGEHYSMARLTSMPHRDTIKLGVEFQSPVGEKATHRLHYFEITPKTVSNLRDLNN